MAGELSSHGVPLPPDLRSGPVIVGIESVQTAGRQLRGAVFLARCWTGRCSSCTSGVG